MMNTNPFPMITCCSLFAWCFGNGKWVHWLSQTNAVTSKSCVMHVVYLVSVLYYICLYYLIKSVLFYAKLVEVLTKSFHRGSCCPVICVSLFHVFSLVFCLWSFVLFVW